MRACTLIAGFSTAAQNAGVGLVVVIPGADMPVMTANQAKMVLEIAAAYGQPLTVERIKELAAIESRPSRARGLSYTVAPFTGAWIETSKCVRYQIANNVAPFTGAWIETRVNCKRLVLITLAPVKGAGL